MSNEIKAMLEAQLKAGKLDSEGSFSLDPEAAKSKLAEFGLDSPEKALLRLAQIAVRARSSQLKFMLGVDTVEMQACDPISELLGFHHPPEELQIALLACLYSGFQSGQVADSGSQRSLSRSGLTANGQLKPIPDVARVQLKRQVEPASGVFDVFRKALFWRIIDSDALASRLCGCPISARLDSRQLNQSPDWDGNACALHLSLLGYPIEDRDEVWGQTRTSWTCRHRFRATRHEKLAIRSNWDCFADFENVAPPSIFGGSDPTAEPDELLEPRVLARLWLPLKDSDPGKLHFISDGIVVGSHSWNNSVTGYVSAATLDTDASGLGLVNNRKVTRIVEYLRKQLQEKVATVSQLELTPALRSCLEGFERAVN